MTAEQISNLSNRFHVPGCILLKDIVMQRILTGGAPWIQF